MKSASLRFRGLERGDRFMDAALAERADRERQFHNARFQAESRESQDKYYWALAHCQQIWESAVVRASTNARVLDYGCALGDSILKVAPLASRVDGIDISDVAIDTARGRATSLGLTNVHLHQMDAQATSFEDDTFDVIFGSGIIHHLDTRASFEEVYRILKPGGLALFKEPLGCNPVINAYRRLTPAARTADEHPLRPVDKRIAESIFDVVAWEHFGLCTIAAVPFRRIGHNRSLYRMMAGFDRLLATVPGVRWHFWHALLFMRKV